MYLFIIFILLLFFIGKQYLSFDVQVGSGNLLNAGTQAENKIDLNVLNSPYAILIDADTGTVIAQRNGDEKNLSCFSYKNYDCSDSYRAYG